MLEEDVDVVGVLDEWHGIDECSFVVGEGLRFEAAMEEGRDVVAHGCRGVGLTLAAEGGGEVGVESGVGGDCEV